MARTQKITIRLNDIENYIIRESASKKQIGVSEYIRNITLSNGGTTTPPLESIINNQAQAETEQNGGKT